MQKKISRNDSCWCGSQKKWKKCHFPKLPAQTFKELQNLYLKKYKIILKNKKQIEKIKIACQTAKEILNILCKEAKIGVTTAYLDKLSQKLHLEKKAIPAPLNYGEPPFPKSICTSLNEVICHGIPNDIPLKNGDIINIDVTSIVDGYYGDCSSMVAIGDISKEKQTLIDVSKECLNLSIKACKPNESLYKIGEIIENHANKFNFSVVDQFVGHGIGLSFHEPPQIFHYKNSFDVPLTPGMVFTIEPMINEGKKGAIIDPKDHWTARTQDNKNSAQWEHTILITESGCEVLTS